MIKFTQIQASELFNFFQTVYQSVPVYEKLSGSFRYIQVILEELLNSKQRFMIQRFNAAALKHLVQERYLTQIKQLSAMKIWALPV